MAGTSQKNPANDSDEFNEFWPDENNDWMAEVFQDTERIEREYAAGLGSHRVHPSSIRYVLIASHSFCANIISISCRIASPQGPPPSSPLPSLPPSSPSIYAVSLATDDNISSPIVRSPHPTNARQPASSSRCSSLSSPLPASSPNPQSSPINNSDQPLLQDQSNSDNDLRGLDDLEPSDHPPDSAVPPAAVAPGRHIPGATLVTSTVAVKRKLGRPPGTGHRQRARQAALDAGEVIEEPEKRKPGRPRKDGPAAGRETPSGVRVDFNVHVRCST